MKYLTTSIFIGKTGGHVFNPAMDSEVFDCYNAIGVRITSPIGKVTALMIVMMKDEPLVNPLGASRPQH